MSCQVVTCKAPVNMAVIKYWGKRDPDLILPLNDSLSVTLSCDQMHAKTSVVMSPDFSTDRLWLNGQEQDIATNARLSQCLRQIRIKAKVQSHVHIASVNNFPTAAGLASSAAGYACLAYSLCKIFGVDQDVDVSELARQGSGSACRSVLGGFVQWHKGIRTDGSDSIATMIRDANHWPELRVLILVVNDSRKKVSSTHGMQNSVDTSSLLLHRAQHIVPDRIRRMIQAINDKDFDTFGQLTMKDSNQLHAVCLDTFPPCCYMNDVSHSIVSFVHQLNLASGFTKLAYTFDAGPNACLFVRQQHLNEVVGCLLHFFPPGPASGKEQSFLRGEAVQPEESSDHQNINFTQQTAGCLKYLLVTKIGHGPEVVSSSWSDDVHLLNKDGLPADGSQSA